MSTAANSARKMGHSTSEGNHKIATEMRRAAAATISSGSEQEDAAPRKPKVALHSHVAPLVARAPFALGEDRKKAYKSAVYYSECYMKGIKPKDADSAAQDVQESYNKWWVNSGFDTRKDPVDEFSLGTKRSRNDDSGNTRKRPRQRGGVRDVIDAVTLGTNGSSASDMDMAFSTSDESGCTSFSSIDGTAKRPIQASLQREHRVSPEPSSTDESSYRVPIRNVPTPSSVSAQQIHAVKSDLIDELKASGGDTSKSSFLQKVASLHSFYQNSGVDARLEGCCYDLDGSWLTLSKPTYSECQGRNENGHYLYTLGRMAFDMFRPTHLNCAIQGIFNTVHRANPTSNQHQLSVPRSLQKQMRADHNLGLRTYNIVVALTTEPDATTEPHRRPVRGIMTNYGYFLPDPHVPNRLSIWFTGGSLEVNDEILDLEEWKRTFHHDHMPRRDLSEYARVLATKILLGASVDDEMQEDGTMSYYLKRPIGGHGSAFCDVLYLDDTLRIMRGHHGSIFVFMRVPSFADGNDD